MWADTKRSWIWIVVRGGKVLPHINRRVLVSVAIAIVTTAVYQWVPAVHLSLTQTPFLLIGLPLGVFLGFRNTSSYDRYWEGRRLWGQIVNTSRSFTRQLLTVVDAPGDEPPPGLEQLRRDCVHLVIEYVHALRHHLRDQPALGRVERAFGAAFAERLRVEENVPVALLQELAERLRAARRAGWLDPLHLPILEASLTSLTDSQGGCERIKATPLPFSYTVLMHRIVGVYCLLLPFGLADSIGWATPLVVWFVSYAFYGLDAIGDEIEQPFGRDPNDLALSSITRTIEINLRRRLGEEVPPPFKPRNGLLI
jgi:ion channel-forming bestrophin family protein